MSSIFFQLYDELFIFSEMEYRSVKMDLRQLSPLATSSNDKSKTISSLEDSQSPEKKGENIRFVEILKDDSSQKFSVDVL